MLDKRLTYKQKRCQEVSNRFSHSAKFLSILSCFLLFSSCRKEWDPNEQFQNNVEILAKQKEQDNWHKKNQAKENLSNLHSKLTKSIVQGLNLKELQNIVGENASILAQKEQNGVQWLILRYQWDDIVENYFSKTSEEYRQCSKQKQYIEITTKNSLIISVTWL
tara:strand:+ start:6509 stop:7000 length:492 start_codon:yes stop_codon:yes gene_type:complete